MPEVAGSAESFRAGSPLLFGSVKLWPIERVVVRSAEGARQAWYCVSKEPYALVVRDAAGLRAVGADGAPIPLEDLRERLAGLDELLR